MTTRLSVLITVMTAFALQGCVAAVLPVIAAGGLAKRQIDQGKKRAQEAEATFEKPAEPAPLPPIVEVLDERVDTPTTADPDSAMTPDERLAQSDIRNIYLPFARYALEQAAKRARGETLQSAVLIEKVSLTNPVAVTCNDKPLAAIIDLDVAPGTPAELEVEAQKGFGPLLEMLRESGVEIAWISGAGEAQIAPQLEILRKGDMPVLAAKDIQLFASRSFRKQELRWQLARNYCVVAVAGDSKSDFDELYDYLRDPDYAIRLEAFMNRGWFLLPPPIAAVDSELLAAPTQ